MELNSRASLSGLVLIAGFLAGGVGASAHDVSTVEIPKQLGCSDLAKAGSTKVEFERLFDPSTGELTVFGESGSYTFNVKDDECLQLAPVRTLINDVLQVHRTNLAEECAGIAEEIGSLDPTLLTKEGAKLDSPKGEVDIDALVRYGKEVCGGDIPASSSAVSKD